MAKQEDILNTIRRNRTAWYLRRQLNQTQQQAQVVLPQQIKSLQGEAVWNNTGLQVPYSAANNFADLKGHAVTNVLGTATVARDANTPTGYSLQFSGAGGIVTYDTDHNVDLAFGPFTIEGWLRSSSATQFSFICGNQQWGLFMNIDAANDGKLAFYTAGGGELVKTGGGFNNGIRHALALVRYGSQYLLFMDGAIAGFAQYISFDVIAASGADLAFGSDVGVAGREFIGALDNWRIIKGQNLYTVPYQVPVPPFPVV